MMIRFNRFGFVDAVIPTDVGITPLSAPGDIIWNLPSNINPSKTIEETQNIQATDPNTGQLLFNEDGTPQFEAQTVSVTYTLMQNPNIFTPDDIETVAISYEVVS